jgi:hypothetical protein
MFSGADVKIVGFVDVMLEIAPAWSAPDDLSVKIKIVPVVCGNMQLQLAVLVMDLECLPEKYEARKMELRMPAPAGLFSEKIAHNPSIYFTAMKRIV